MPIFRRNGNAVLMAVLAAGLAVPFSTSAALAFGTKVTGEEAAADEAVVAVSSTIETKTPSEAVVTVSSNIEAKSPSEERVLPGPAKATLTAAGEEPLAETASGPPSANELFARGLVAYRAGDGVLAVESWTEAADRGHIVAQWNLARLYRRDDLVEPDANLAVHYLRAVANQHDPNRIRDTRSAMTIAALVELADVYKAGEPDAGIDPNPPQAARLYELAATLYGSARAQHQLGMMYLSGDGVSQHIGRAMRWLALSASKRYAPSLAALGDFFWSQRENGNNKVQGLMWLSLARENAKRDDLRAIVEDLYDEALTEASEEERERAMALIQTWNRTHAAQ